VDLTGFYGWGKDIMIPMTIHTGGYVSTIFYGFSAVSSVLIRFLFMTIPAAIASNLEIRICFMWKGKFIYMTILTFDVFMTGMGYVKGNVCPNFAFFMTIKTIFGGYGVAVLWEERVKIEGNEKYQKHQ